MIGDRAGGNNRQEMNRRILSKSEDRRSGNIFVTLDFQRWLISQFENQDSPPCFPFFELFSGRRRVLFLVLQEDLSLNHNVFEGR